MVIISLYNLVNTFWVAKLGYQAVAAITAIFPFFILCIAVGAGTGVGINALASRRFGEKKDEEANCVAAQSFFLVITFGTIFIIISNFLTEPILRLCGTPSDVMVPAGTYLKILGFATPLFFFSIMSRNILAASGDTFHPMIFTIIGQAINVVLDPFLIFGWWIFPEMGVGGAALATVIASGINGLLVLGYLLRGKTSYNFRFRHIMPRFSIIKDIYRVGFPSMIMQALEAIIFSMFNHVAASFGSIVLAAVGIAIRIADLAFMPVIGVAHGLLPIIGFSFGAKLWDRLWKAVKLASLGIASFLLAATICLEVFTHQIVSVFNANPELLAIAVPGMRIFCATFVVIGPTVLFITTFQGLSRGREALILNIFRQFAFFVPGLYLFTHLWGLTGVWLTMPVADFFGFLVAGTWLYQEYSKQKKSGLWNQRRTVETVPVSNAK